ncbi:AI-2E family transporter, partial [Clostridium chrysemydis]
IIVKEYVIVIGLIFLYCLVQITREILEAKLLSNKFNLHPLVVFISVYIGIKVFGVLGAFVGPIYCMISRDILINE